MTFIKWLNSVNSTETRNCICIVYHASRICLVSTFLSFLLLSLFTCNLPEFLTFWFGHTLNVLNHKTHFDINNNQRKSVIFDWFLESFTNVPRFLH